MLYGVSVFAVIRELRPVRHKHVGFPLDSAAFSVGTAATGSGPCFLYGVVVDPLVDAVIHYGTEAGVTASRVTLRSCGVLPEKGTMSHGVSHIYFLIYNIYIYMKK